MSETSKIEWTDATWNPVTGCSKISPGCKNCYAARDWQRLSKNPKTGYYGREFTDVEVHPAKLEEPMRWRRPRRIFVNSMSDLFHEAVPFEFIDKVLAVATIADQHVYQVLTKRAQRMAEYFADRRKSAHRNVWLGVSAERQEEYDERVPWLMEVDADVHFVSLEPLLGHIDLRGATMRDGDGFGPDLQHVGSGRGIDWVIAGGESGPGARPAHPDWARVLRNQCAGAGVPFFWKQWGEWLPGSQAQHLSNAALSKRCIDETVGGDLAVSYCFKVGKKAAGALLDGCEHREFPDDLPC